MCTWAAVPWSTAVENSVLGAYTYTQQPLHLWWQNIQKWEIKLSATEHFAPQPASTHPHTHCTEYSVNSPSSQSVIGLLSSTDKRSEKYFTGDLLIQIRWGPSTYSRGVDVSHSVGSCSSTFNWAVVCPLNMKLELSSAANTDCYKGKEVCNKVKNYHISVPYVRWCYHHHPQFFVKLFWTVQLDL